MGYKGFGNIVCDKCMRILNYIDYIIIKGKNRILHYCSEECKEKHYHNKENP